MDHKLIKDIIIAGVLTGVICMIIIGTMIIVAIIETPNKLDNEGIERSRFYVLDDFVLPSGSRYNYTFLDVLPETSISWSWELDSTSVRGPVTFWVEDDNGRVFNRVIVDEGTYSENGRFFVDSQGDYTLCWENNGEYDLQINVIKASAEIPVGGLHPFWGPFWLVVFSIPIITLYLNQKKHNFIAFKRLKKSHIVLAIIVVSWLLLINGGIGGAFAYNIYIIVLFVSVFVQIKYTDLHIIKPIRDIGFE